jgi:predicted ArsR family transcriptional regulator
MSALSILNHLKKHGEQLDAEIAVALSISLDKTRAHLAQLTTEREVMTYHSTRFIDGQKTEGIRCRLVGYTPPSAPGRKAC